MKWNFSGANRGAIALLTGATMLVPISFASAVHVYAGVADANGIAGVQAGEALAFVDEATGQVLTGASFGLQTTTRPTLGREAGLYRATGLTFTSLAASARVLGEGGEYEPQSLFSALPGSYLELKIDGLIGPAGGVFAFWETGATVPTTTWTVGGGFTGTGKFDLTDRTVPIGDGITKLPAGAAYHFPDALPAGFTWNDADANEPGVAVTDPFGHIHGRSFTFSQPGTYTVSYVLHDTTGTQADSQPFVVTYSAVPEPASTSLLIGGLLLGLVCGRPRALSRQIQ